MNKIPQDLHSQRISFFGHKDFAFDVIVTIFVAAIATILLTGKSIQYIFIAGSSMTSAPAEYRYDDVDYDNIAFAILKHGEFAFDWDNPEWRDRFIQDNHDGRFDPVLTLRHGYGVTTFKAPVYPVLLATVYHFFGTDFIVGRILSLTLMMSSVAAIVIAAGLLGGIPAAIITALVCLLRPQPKVFGAMLMTEGVTTFFFTATFLVILLLFWRNRHFPKKDNLAFYFAAGVFFGLCALSRSVYVLWLPFILAAGFFEYLRSTAKRKTILIRWSIFLLSALVVLFPWWIRNSIVSEHFAPLGSQGAINLPASYSDGSYEGWGEWHYPTFIQTYTDFDKEHQGLDVPPPVYEYLRGKYASKKAREWIGHNWQKLPALFLMRIYTHHVHPQNMVLPDNPPLRVGLILFLIAGFVGWMARPERWIFLCLMLIDSIVAAGTYGTMGKNLTPVVPAYALTTAGILFLPRLLLTFARIESVKSFPLSKLKLLFEKARLLLGPVYKELVMLFRDKKIQAGVILMIVLGLFVVMVRSTLDWNINMSGKFNALPECVCDDADYENLAFSLYKNGEYAYNWGDPEWRQRYIGMDTNNRYADYLKRTGHFKTMYLPPLHPIILSFTYKFFGTGFLAPRILSLVFMTLSIGIIVLFAGLRFGVLAAFLTALIYELRHIYPNFAASFFTESLASFLFSVFTILYFFLQLPSARSNKRRFGFLSALTGFSLGLLVLSRSIFVLWIPFLLLPSFLQRDRYRFAFKKPDRFFVILILSFLVTVSPWWIRNCWVSGHFAPLGSQGTTALPGAYSDEALRTKGSWNGTVINKLYQDFESSFKGGTASAPEYEFLRGQYALKLARDWILKNPEKLPKLFWMRLVTHYTVSPSSHYQYLPLLLVLMLVGTLAWLMVPGGWVFGFLLLIDAVVITLTYEADGRYIVPVTTLISLASSGVIFVPRLLRFLRARLSTQNDIQNPFGGFFKGS